MRLRIFADRTHFRPETSRYLNDICRALWLQADVRPGSRGELFEESRAPEEAELCLLPLKWAYYVDFDASQLADRAIMAAREVGRPIAVFNDSDFRAHLPWKDAILFQTSVYRSRRGEQEHALPAFVDDLVERYWSGTLRTRLKHQKPVIGFCGQAGGTRLRVLARKALRAKRALAYKLRLAPWEPSPIEHTTLRMRVLDVLQRSPHVRTEFRVRDRYRAGLRSSARRKDPYEQSRLDFIHNLANTDYTVCVRGKGNFSVRFYETLCMGRIPIFVDTDCSLPFDTEIDWRRFCVWVDESEIPFVAEKVAEFHASLTARDFLELQHECRRIWREWLSYDGFYRQLHRLLPSVRNFDKPVG